MANITNDQIADIATTTLAQYDKPKFEQVSADYQNHVFMSEMLMEPRVKKHKGERVSRRIMLDRGEVARHTGLFEADNIQLKGDLLSTATAEWRHAHTHWTFERREFLQQDGESMLTNIIDPRRAGALIDLAEELELAGWSVPGTAADEVYPNGVPYSVVWNATPTTASSFTGTVPTGHTTVFGINPTTKPRWRNGSYTYTAATYDDIGRNLRIGAMNARWKVPRKVNVNDHSKTKMTRFKYYTTQSVLLDLEDQVRAQNDRLGFDLDPAGGLLRFQRAEFEWAPFIDANLAANPIYGIDHNVFEIHMLEGDVFAETSIKEHPDAHNTFIVHVDLTYSFMVLDRRRLFVVATADPTA